MPIESYKNKRVLISSYQPYAVQVVQKFTKEFNWQPAVWFVADENRDVVSQVYPEVFQYDFFDVVKGILPQGIELHDLLWPSPDELLQLSQYEFNFLYMLERNDSNDSAFEYKERLAFYYHLIGLWKRVVHRYQIDLIKRLIMLYIWLLNCLIFPQL